MGSTLLVTSPGACQTLLQSLLSAKARSLSVRPIPWSELTAQCLLLRLWSQTSHVSRCLRCVHRTKDVTLCSALSLRLLLNSQEFSRCIEM